MKSLIKLLFFVILILVISFYSFKYYCLKHQPIKMQYPKLPKNLEEIIRWADEWTVLTANIVWYEATETATGIKYYVNVSDKIYIRLKDNHENTKWELISQKDYRKRFNNGNEIGFTKLFKDDNKGIFEKGYMYYDETN